MPALLTAVPGFVKWLAELSGGEAIGLLVGGMGATVWLIVKGVVAGFRKKTAAETAKVDVPVAPMPVAPPALPPPSPATNAAPHDYEAELQALRIQRIQLEDELLAVQTSARNLRKVHDAAVFELAAMSKSLYAERAANEELRGQARALLAEMARLRRDGPSTPPPRGRRRE